MTWVRSDVSRTSRRRLGDFFLFGVTSVELILLFFLTPTFTIADWVYVSQHLLVLGIAMDELAAKLQKEGAESFVKPWEEMTDVVANKAQTYK